MKYQTSYLFIFQAECRKKISDFIFIESMTVEELKGLSFDRLSMQKKQNVKL